MNRCTRLYEAWVARCEIRSMSRASNRSKAALDDPESLGLGIPLGSSQRRLVTGEGRASPLLQEHVGLRPFIHHNRYVDYSAPDWHIYCTKWCFQRRPCAMSLLVPRRPMGQGRSRYTPAACAKTIRRSKVSPHVLLLITRMHGIRGPRHVSRSLQAHPACLKAVRTPLAHAMWRDNASRCPPTRMCRSHTRPANTVVKKLARSPSLYTCPTSEPAVAGLRVLVLRPPVCCRGTGRRPCLLRPCIGSMPGRQPVNTAKLSYYRAAGAAAHSMLATPSVRVHHSNPA